jgi:hypothetical protein
MSTDFQLHDDGKPDAVAPRAKQHPLEDPPVDVLTFLLGSRYRRPTGCQVACCSAQ